MFETGAVKRRIYHLPDQAATRKVRQRNSWASFDKASTLPSTLSEKVVRDKRQRCETDQEIVIALSSIGGEIRRSKRLREMGEPAGLDAFSPDLAQDSFPFMHPFSRAIVISPRHKPTPSKTSWREACRRSSG